MGNPNHTPQSMQKMTRYLTSVLCPALDIPPIFEEVSLPNFGVKSTLLLVRPRDRSPFVFRCFDGTNEAETFIRISQFADARNLPTPRLRYSDISSAHYRRHGFGAVVEELIEGEHIENGSAGEAQLDSLGRGLAKLHSIESDQWGVPGKLKSGAFFDPMILTKIENRLGSVMKFDPEFKREWKGQILDFARSFRKEWNGGPPYSLTHDKINRGNVVFPAEGLAHFVDLISLRFGIGAKDLIAALYYFCDGPEQERRVLDVYFSALPPERREHFERFEPLYRMWHHLSRWASKGRGLAKRSNRPTDSEIVAALEREREATLAWLKVPLSK